MTVTIKTTKSQRVAMGTFLWFDILADGKRVGSAAVKKYHGKNYFGNIIEEFARLERINIDEEHKGKGYGRSAIKAMCKAFGRIVAAVGYGVYVFS